MSNFLPIVLCRSTYPIQQGIAKYHATDEAFRKRVAEVQAEQLANGGAFAPIICGAEGFTASRSAGSGAAGPLLVGSRTSRVMLRPQAWGQVQIKDTTFVHEWPLAGHGLLPRSHPEMRGVAEFGEKHAGTARVRMWPECAPPLQPDELAVRLRDEMAPMVGRGKMSVDGPAADGKTSWEAARGKGRNSELAVRFGKDNVKPLIRDVTAEGDSQEPAARGSRGLAPHEKAHIDHVHELIRADEQGPQPTPQMPRFHAHRAAVDSVGTLML
jgi:hypothetical protein